MKKILFALITFSILLFQEGSFADVWTSTGEWNDHWEEVYSQWILKEYNEDFFVKGRWANIPTDCAKAVYFARAIFAYENKLPFAVRDSTGGSGFISNKMKRWDSSGKSDDSKFKSFLDYLSDMVDTSTLPNDTYPILIQRRWVRSGTVWSRVRVNSGNILDYLFGGNARGVSGHSELVKEVKDTGVIYLIGSTVPIAVRNLIKTSSFVFLPKDSSTGLRQWIQPQNYRLSKEKQPGYSLEQYTLGSESGGGSGGGFYNDDPISEYNRIGSGGGYGGGSPREGGGNRTIGSFTQAVHDRLRLRGETREETFERYAMDLCSLVAARAEVVTQAYLYKKKAQRCFNAEEYESFSTPSRDQRISDTLNQFLKLNGGGFFNDGFKGLEKYFALCVPFDMGNGEKMFFERYMRLVKEGAPSSNPNDPINARWGLEKSSTSCPRY